MQVERWGRLVKEREDACERLGLPCRKNPKEIFSRPRGGRGEAEKQPRLPEPAGGQWRPLRAQERRALPKGRQWNRSQDSLEEGQPDPAAHAPNLRAKGPRGSGGGPLASLSWLQLLDELQAALSVAG